MADHSSRFIIIVVATCFVSVFLFDVLGKIEDFILKCKIKRRVKALKRDNVPLTQANVYDPLICPATYVAANRRLWLDKHRSYVGLALIVLTLAGFIYLYIKIFGFQQ